LSRHKTSRPKDIFLYAPCASLACAPVSPLEGLLGGPWRFWLCRHCFDLNIEPEPGSFHKLVISFSRD
jgi:hypothetical protein